MSDIRHDPQEIRRFILERIAREETSPTSISRLVASRFEISRQAANRYVRHLVGEGLVAETGRTKAKQYNLITKADEAKQFALSPNLEEHSVWEEFAKPIAQPYATANVFNILNYGFTEMLNNAIEHSLGSSVLIKVTVTPVALKIIVWDNGIGIFRKIQKDLGLDNPQQVLLELSKGKLTTDPDKHTGEGIFFASRMFDEFLVLSDDIGFVSAENDDWLLERHEAAPTKGTSVSMKISPFSKREAKEVFTRYEGEEFGFQKTHVPVELARYEGETLVSRSQARRLLARFDKFKEVFLNFKGVSMIGQAFADEIFRVYQNEHPEIKIVYVNASPDVEHMILRAKAGPNGAVLPFS
jgi:anti-sigma regulatory factor (Ser/Thr protein kinase)